jgi:chromosome segregation ATPase
VEEIESLKSQLDAKEKERVETVEALHNVESRCISMEAKLEGKTEDFDNLKEEFDNVVREKKYLEKKAVERDQSFHKNVIGCGNFAKIVMTNLARSQKILVGNLESLIHSLAGYAANMKTC